MSIKSVTFNSFAQNILYQKYSHTKGDGTKESWTEIAKRVAYTVTSILPNNKETKDQIFEYIRDMKFIPGGRYLYATGRPHHMINNCFLFRPQDSREGK